MKAIIRLLLPVLLSALCFVSALSAQEAEPLTATEGEDAPEEEGYDDQGWPQVYETSNGYEVAVHQPQIHDWSDYRRMTARAALVIRPKDGDEESIQ